MSTAASGIRIATTLNRNMKSRVLPFLYAMPAIERGMYAAKKAADINITNFWFVISFVFIMLYS